MTNSRPTHTAFVPHGIDENKFYPIDENSKDYIQYKTFKEDFDRSNSNDFLVFWNNRNIRRKQPGDLILAYRTFCDSLTKEQAKRVIMLMHTQVSDENGTNLMVVKETLCREYKVVFSPNKVSSDQLNYYYNMADVTVNIASNEGFGLSGAESLMAGTVILNNVTGGLQDQCRFEDEDGNWIVFNSEYSSNHTGVYRKHGVWAYPVYPSNRSLQGSVPTPYIFDDRCKFEDVAVGLKYWYDMGREKRKALGLIGRDWLIGKESNMSAKSMGNNFIKHLDFLFDTWKPVDNYSLYKVDREEPQILNDGIIF